jgi:hypothetical protein
MSNEELLFKKCPSLLRVDQDALDVAIARMAVAHIMNGGDWHGWLETAVAYLESIG